MAIFKTCCCCCRVRSGCLVAAIFFMAIASVDLANGVHSLKEGFKPVLFSSAVSDAVMIIMSVVLVLGVLMANKWVCLAWITYAAVFMATGTIIGIVHVATEAIELENIIATLIRFDNGNGTTYNVQALRQGKAMELAILLAVYIVVAIPMAILVLVVFSHYQNLRDGVEDEESLPMPYEMTEYNGLSKQRRKQEKIIREGPSSAKLSGYSKPRPQPPRSIMLHPDVHMATYLKPEVYLAVRPRLEARADCLTEITNERCLTLEAPNSRHRTTEVVPTGTPIEEQTPTSRHSDGARTCTEVMVFTDSDREVKTASDLTHVVQSSEKLSPDVDVTSACIPTCTSTCLQQETLLPNQPEQTHAANHP